MKHCSVIAVIPARYASSRFPGKMLAPIMGKSLLHRTWERVQKCPQISSIVVAADSELVYNHVQSFGGIAVMTSPDHQTGSDRIIEVLKRYPELTQADVILNVQGDEPCISHDVLHNVSSTLLSNPEECMASVCVPISDPDEINSPSVVKCVMDRNDYALYFSRSPIPGVKPLGKHAPFYYKHLGIYAFRRDFLLKYGELPVGRLQLVEDLEQLKVLEAGYKIRMVYTNECSPAVDIPEDIERVKKWLCSQYIYS